MNHTNEELAQLEKTYEELGQKIKAFKETQFENPLVMKNNVNGAIVKFTELRVGDIVWSGNSSLAVGYYSEFWEPHTDTDYWTPVPHDKERDLWHGQPTECWDYEDTHVRNLGFYDAINKRTFYFGGSLNGNRYDKYEAVDSKHYKPWMLEAYKTLEGISK